MDLNSIKHFLKGGSKPEERSWDPEEFFSSFWYLRHNARRQEHLGSLNLDIFNKSVLEVGAGNWRSYYILDRSWSENVDNRAKIR